MGEIKNPIEKVDMVIGHISDCILEQDNRPCGTQDGIPALAEALAALLNARTAAAAIDTCRR